MTPRAKLWVVAPMGAGKTYAVGHATKDLNIATSDGEQYVLGPFNDAVVGESLKAVTHSPRSSSLWLLREALLHTRLSECAAGDRSVYDIMFCHTIGTALIMTGGRCPARLARMCAPTFEPHEARLRERYVATPDLAEAAVRLGRRNYTAVRNATFPYVLDVGIDDEGKEALFTYARQCEDVSRFFSSHELAEILQAQVRGDSEDVDQKRVPRSEDVERVGQPGGIGPLDQAQEPAPAGDAAQ